jgi:hypothetical protein
MKSRWRLALAVLAAGACARSRTTLPVEPGATFAIHPERDGFVVDRMRDGGTGVLEEPGWLHDPSGPSFILRSGADIRAALWLVGRSRVLVREDPSTLAPRTGEVLVSWADGAARLTLWARDGSTLQTDTFGREDAGTAPALLSRDRVAAGVAGTYRAVVRDAGGTAVGWMRVRIPPDPHEARSYDAAFPARVDDGLAAAASVALDTEVGWLEEHASGARGSEEEQRDDHRADRDAGSQHAEGHLPGLSDPALDRSRGAGGLRNVLQVVRIEHLDALLVGPRHRVDALLGAGGNRRDGLLGDLRGGGRGQRKMEDEDQSGRAELHRAGA